MKFYEQTALDESYCLVSLMGWSFALLAWFCWSKQPGTSIHDESMKAQTASVMRRYRGGNFGATATGHRPTLTNAPFCSENNRTLAPISCEKKF